MSNEEWYTPLDKTEVKSAAEKKKTPNGKKTKVRVISLICLVLLLIIGSSVAFGGKAEPAVSTIPDGDSDNYPKNWKDLLDSYYTAVKTDTADVDIPKYEGTVSYSLMLEDPGESFLSLQELYEKCVPSIVGISGYSENSLGYNWGTGIIASADGLIITNAHVVDGCKSAKVTLFDDTEYDAYLVGCDVISDIAVLKIEADGLTPAQFADSDTLSVGDSVAAIGNPLGEELRATLTDGIISAISRGINYNGRSMTLLQTNTAINAGNSGGALFNMYGQVVGITNMKMISSYSNSSVEGIGFAIPSDTVKSIFDALVKDGEVSGRPALGITLGPIPESVTEKYGLPAGLYVTEVKKGTDAFAQGLRKGDIITEVNGQEVTTTAQVSAIKDELSVGDTMHMVVWRDGETLEFDIKVMDTNDVY